MGVSRLKLYYHLTKPGIIRGNLIVAIGAYLFGAGKSVDALTLGSMIVGLAAIIAAGCVLNNVLDRKIDAKMQRTKNRALVTGAVEVRSAYVFGFVLAIVGTVALSLGTNVVALLVALTGLFLYVVIYGIGKRTTVHGTLIGALSGAVPPVVGYTAATAYLDTNAWLLFLILVVWQMPHFYAIAIFRAKEYAAANLPVITSNKSISAVKPQIMIYVILFALVTPLLAVVGSASISYLIIMTIVSVYWFAYGLRNYRRLDNDKWGRGMFGTSLMVLLTFAVLIAVDVWLQ